MSIRRCKRMSKYEAVVVFSVKNGDDVSALVEKFKALI